jgi:hypothetical protein
MRTAETILNIIHDRGKRKLPLDEVYRQLFNPNMYLQSYARLSRNTGAMTPGIMKETVDGMSMVRIPVIPATQSGGKLPPNPEEACHRFQTKAATPSERSDAWSDRVTLSARRLSRACAVCASNLL